MSTRDSKATDAELAILKLLWRGQALTAREIRDQLYPAGTPSDNATVQKLLQRLEQKGLISRDRSAFAHRFQAKVSHGAMVGRQLEALAEKLTDGSMVPIIMHVVGNKKLTAEEREQIRRLLDEQKRVSRR
jgi:predicted transcriptional regulator